MKQPVRVAVTGAAGQIGYALLFRIASGEMLGKDQPVILQLLELPMEKAQAALKGVMMELEDCAFPLLAGMVGTDDAEVAFKDADIALLVGARPRGPGMERKDLLLENAKIFTAQGAALNKVASRDVKVLVVGNPANTNAYIAMKSAPDLQGEELHRDAAPGPQPRAVAARRQGRRGRRPTSTSWSCGATTRRRCIRTTASPPPNGSSLKDKINDADWNAQHLHPAGRQARRGDHRSARPVVGGSAANAAIDHIRDWVLGSNGKWVTMGVPSDGSYGIPEGVIYGVPVTTANGEYTRVEGLPVDEFSRAAMDKTLAELEEERAGVAHLL